MNQTIRKKLDRITNILFSGGVVNPITYIEQISYLIYLKLLDEKESQKDIKEKLGAKNGKSLFPEQADRYRWSNWKFMSGDKLRNFVRDEVFYYLANSLVKDDPQVAEYFRDAVLEVVDPNVLKSVIDEIDTINFLKLGQDEKGDIYEYLLTYLGKIDAKTLGTFRTPRQIRQLMVELLDPDFGNTIFDPACGTGGFLIDSLEYILSKYSETQEILPIYGEEWLIDEYIKRNPDKENLINNENNFKVPENFINELINENPKLQTYKKGVGDKIPNWELLEKSLYGIDVSRQIMRIAIMNSVLHDIPKANIKRANSLSSMGGLSDDDIIRKYNIILSNPPFAGALPSESIREDLPINSRKSELLFMSVMMSSLAHGGKAAVVVPEGLLFGGTGAHKNLRERLLNKFQVLAIISMPSGVFRPYAGVKTSIIVFRRPKQELKKENTKKVWFYEIKNDGFDPDKITGGGRPETPNKNDIPDLLKLWVEYKKSDFENPPGVESGALLNSDIEEIKCWWANYELIRENEFNLSAGRYKPQIIEKPPGEDPKELIGEILIIEENIKDKLKDLLEDITELS
jgi:type I restriction enzyme M protein